MMSYTMRHHNPSNKKKKILLRASLLVAGLVLVLGLVSPGKPQPVRANTETDLRNQIAQLEAEIAAKEAELSVISAQASDLSNKLNELRIDIAKINQQIELTTLKINDLRIQIEATQAELDRQREILARSINTLYKKSKVTSVELLAASASFTQFINEQEYLERIKNSVAESAKKVKELKDQLVLQEEEQKKLLEQQEAQRGILQGREQEQAVLLEQTRGEEARYQSLVSELKEEHGEIERRLQNYLASLLGSAANLGPVKRGQFIGRVGNTGYSTGPHVHFSTYNSGGYQNPNSVLGQYGWGWPVGGSGGYVSQGFHGGHSALDIAAGEGTPLVAVADGTIVARGCMFSGDYHTFGVVINHGNGYLTSYIHMQAPNNPAYASCSINRYGGSYGTPSIDYGTTY